MPTFELLYEKSHEWLGILEDNTAYVGVSSYLIEHLKTVVGVSLPEVGQEIYRGISFGALEKTDEISELYAPTSGKILETNTKFVNELNTDDPWLLRIQVRIPANISTLLHLYEYKNFIEKLS